MEGHGRPQEAMGRYGSTVEDDGQSGKAIRIRVGYKTIAIVKCSGRLADPKKSSIQPAAAAAAYSVN